jgi:hypothetical protein
MEVIKYQRIEITPTPTETFSELVTITKAPSKWKSLVGKKFINEEKCKAFISYTTAQQFVEKVKQVAQTDLIDLGLKEDF